MLQEKMNIVVLCGGTSTEREISIVSGEGVARALRAKGHRAILLDVFFGDERIDFMDAFPDQYDVAFAAAEIRANDRYLFAAENNPSRSFFGPNVRRICRMADIVFLALHGANGEDGKIQAAFDLEKIRYTGAGYISSAFSMDKGLTKLMLGFHGVRVPKGTVVSSREGYVDPEDLGLSYPVVAKVACGGSSVGVFICQNEKEYAKSLERCFELESQVVVYNRPKTVNETIYYNVDMLHSAIFHDRQIRFQYVQWTVSKEMALRHGGDWYYVSPWGLLWDDENYYLIAYDSENREIRHYRVDKMLHIETQEQERDGEEQCRPAECAQLHERLALLEIHEARLWKVPYPRCGISKLPLAITEKTTSSRIDNPKKPRLLK